MGDWNDNVICPYCQAELRPSKNMIKIHMNSFHKPEGYSWDVEYVRHRTNRCKTLFQLIVTGPCLCSCGEILSYPNEKGWLPKKEPPFYIAGHNTKQYPYNAGSFPKGHVPANKGTKGMMKANITSFKKGHVPTNYNGGVSIVSGYAYVLDPSGEKHPSGVRKRLSRARMVMEEQLGRKLTVEEIVWHNDKNSLNDIPENLEVITRRESRRRQSCRPKPRKYKTKSKIENVLESEPEPEPELIPEPEPVPELNLEPERDSNEAIQRLKDEKPFGICPMCKGLRTPAKDCKCDG